MIRIKTTFGSRSCLIALFCQASRAMVKHLVEYLNIPAFALTDYNPHGMSLMLCFKHGSVVLHHCLPNEDFP